MPPPKKGRRGNHHTWHIISGPTEKIDIDIIQNDFTARVGAWSEVFREIISRLAHVQERGKNWKILHTSDGTMYRYPDTIAFCHYRLFSRPCLIVSNLKKIH